MTAILDQSIASQLREGLVHLVCDGLVLFLFVRQLVFQAIDFLL